MEKEVEEMDVVAVQGSPLFRGMGADSIERALSALYAQERRYRKQDLILRVGTTTNRIGIVLEGNVTIESNDVWGNRTILGSIGPKNAFAESYALLEGEPLLVDVRANGKCRVLFLRVDALRRMAQERQPWAIELGANLLMDSARKNLMLSRKSFFIAPKGIRARVMAYLNAQSIQAGSTSFSIPFDRQQLADYLNVDRSALSKELGRMRREGLIACRKNRFTLLAPEE
jgi:CRP-like cAMP-binding protein